MTYCMTYTLYMTMTYAMTCIIIHDNDICHDLYYYT